MKYKICSKNKEVFGALQVILSNGSSSPVFTAKYENDKDMQTFDVQDYAMVKRVNGSDSGSAIHKLSFTQQDGTEITKVEIANWNPYGQESVIADDEEIIGVFGTISDSNFVYQLGFIVWKPPRI